MTVPGGYPTRAPWAPPGTARPVDGAAEAVRAVAELAGAGAAVIKVALDDRVGPTLPAPVLAALVGAAGEHGLGVTAHVGTAGEAAKALAAGVGELAHWPFDPRPLPDALVDALAESVVAVPTLHIDPTRARRAGVRRFVARGGRVVYGTDLGNQGPPPAVDTEELRLLVEAGLAPGGPWPPPPRWPPPIWGWPAPAWSLPAHGRISCWSTATRWTTWPPFRGFGWSPATAGSRRIPDARAGGSLAGFGPFATRSRHSD